MFHVSPHLKAYLNVPLLFKVKQNAPFKKHTVFVNGVVELESVKSHQFTKLLQCIYF